MAITIPTTEQLFNDIIADIEAELSVTIPDDSKNFLRTLAGVQAAKLKLFYLQSGFVQKNVWPDLADTEANGGTLERFGRVKLGRDPLAPQAGLYLLDVTGQIGGTIPANTTYKSDDTSLSPGQLFIVDVGITLIATTGQVQVRALEAGLDSKLNVGDTLTLTAPIANVDAQATVNNEDQAPLAGESEEDYRENTIEAFQLEPQGGAASDYRIWSSDAQGVKQVYPFAVDSAIGELNVFVEATIADSTDGKGTPGAGILSDVEDVIEQDPDTTKPLNERGRRPISAFIVDVQSITIQDVEIEIINLANDTPAIRDLIEDAITALLEDIRPFVAGADALADKNDVLSVTKVISTIQDAIGPANTFDDIVLEVATITITTSIQFFNGDIPFLDAITYT